MKKTVIIYKTYLDFIKSLKNKSIYEFSLYSFVDFLKIDEQTARRFLNYLVELNELKQEFYYKTNKKKYLIIN